MPKNELNPLARTGITIAMIAAVPALFLFAYAYDDSAAEAALKAERLARQEAKYRQLEYDEIGRRLGNERGPD